MDQLCYQLPRVWNDVELAIAGTTGVPAAPSTPLPCDLQEWIYLHSPARRQTTHQLLVAQTTGVSAAPSSSKLLCKITCRIEWITNFILVSTRAPRPQIALNCALFHCGTHIGFSHILAVQDCHKAARQGHCMREGPTRERQSWTSTNEVIVVAILQTKGHHAIMMLSFGPRTVHAQHFCHDVDGSLEISAPLPHRHWPALCQKRIPPNTTFCLDACLGCGFGMHVWDVSKAQVWKIISQQINATICLEHHSARGQNPLGG